MNIVPLGHHILVKPDDIEETDESYAAAKRLNLEIVGHEKNRDQAAVEKGTVVAIGNTAYKDYNCEPWCKVGDVVGYVKHGGKFIKDSDDTLYIILNDGDLICRYAVKETNE